MRLGGSIQKEYDDLEMWLSFVKEIGYSAVVCPFDYSASKEEKKKFKKIIKENDLVLGEIGVWRNTLSLDDKERKESIEYAKNQLSLSQELNANCCVNIVGARGEKWDGIYKENYTEDTYAMIVDVIREIIDFVNPNNTFYTIEPMPWMVPDSPEQYLNLIKDVDRKAFGVHLDYTNMINSPQKYIDSDKYIEHCFTKLSKYIKSVHVKDAMISQDILPCCIQETMPGHGSFDFAKILKLCSKLGDDMTIYVEHLTTHEEYNEACKYLRSIARKENISIK